MGDKTTRFSSNPANSVNIRRAGVACASCGTGFEDGQEHFSILRHDEPTGEWHRGDFCLGCWDGVLEGEDGRDLYSLWRTRYIDRNAARRTPANEYTPLLEICYDALHSEEAEQQGLAYLSAMVLRRQKVFRLVRSERAEDNAPASLLFYDKVNQAEIRVPDPPMTLDDLRATRRVLQSRLTPLPAEGCDVPDQEVAHERE